MRLILLLAAALVLPLPVVAEVGSPERIIDVKRIHVERLGGGETADQIRDMIIAGIQRTGLFVLTDNPKRADAVLRGSAEDLVFNETFDTREGINARSSVSLGSSSRSGGSSSRRTGGVYVQSSIGEDESRRIVERRHEAVAAVRLVNHEGDVIWSTVQESRGGKFRGASADVAAKVTRQLLKDYKRTKLASTGNPAKKPPAR